MEPHETSHLSVEEKKAFFRKATITHRLLGQTHRTIVHAVREPAGFAFLLVHGPTGVGKTRMIETLSRHLTEQVFVPREPLSPPSGLASLSMPVLVIEVDLPDKSAFDRATFYRTVLTLLGERTYPQHIHVDIHAETAPPKRRPLRGKAAESNDLPELKEATKDAMGRHGVRVVILDEAHHILYGGNGMAGSTLQEQLEWLKSLSSTTGALYILVGTYDLFNFGKLNGQIARRCLPVHFPRYQLEREEDCLEFQAALLELLRRVPLSCEAERWVTSHWLYFYECSVGCIGVLKDWLLRAVSTALDEGLTTLSLDWVQDHALPVDIYRQMTLDAYEGEQKLNHTASNREHVWRLLQGGELIAPVPPLPPRETSTLPNISPVPAPQEPETSSGSTPVGTEAHIPNGEMPKIKKPRSRKKVEAPPSVQEPASVIQASDATAEAVPKPARGRRKRTAEPAVETTGAEGKSPSSKTGNAPSMPTDPETVALPAKPKRTRRVGAHQPKRYSVGEQERELS
jgi:AAA domain